MLQTETTAKVQEIQFDDADVVNPDDYIPAGNYNLENVRPWLLHDHGFVVAVVFANSMEGAIDIAADEEKLKRFALSEEDLKEYHTQQTLGQEPEEVGVARVGSHSEPFDLQNLDVIELENPPFSFVALYNAAKDNK